MRRDMAWSEVAGSQPSKIRDGCQAAVAGAGRLAPVLTQSVLWPRHFIAATPSTTVTPSVALSSSAGCSGSVGGFGDSAGGVCLPPPEELPCWQQGIVQPGLPSQQDLGFGGAGFGAQQHLPSWQSSVAQPHAFVLLLERDSAGTGTPNTATR